MEENDGGLRMSVMVVEGGDEDGGKDEDRDEGDFTDRLSGNLFTRDHPSQVEPRGLEDTVRPLSLLTVLIGHYLERLSRLHCRVRPSLWSESQHRTVDICARSGRGTGSCTSGSQSQLWYGAIVSQINKKLQPA